MLSGVAALTGRGIRIAVVDSGVHASHPHVNGISGGVAIDAQGTITGDVADRLGHGTAVTAAIREKAPDAEIFAVRVFDRALATSITALVAAIDWAADHGIHLVNLSLGTSKSAHEPALRDAVARAAAKGAVVVSARQDEGVHWLPGSLTGVVSVEVDYAIPRDRLAVALVDGRQVFRASGFAREIPGVPPERNLHGISFAVANVTGFAARALESIGAPAPVDALITALAASVRVDAS